MARARQHGRGAHPGRPDRALHLRPRALRPPAHLESIAGSRSGTRMFERTEVVRALEKRGFEDIRQRITGVTQFVGGRLATRLGRGRRPGGR